MHTEKNTDTIFLCMCLTQAWKNFLRRVSMTSHGYILRMFRLFLSLKTRSVS